MLQGEHSTILLTCIKQKSVLKYNFGLLIEWLLKAGFTLLHCFHRLLTVTGLTLFILKDFPMHVDRISMELSILY